MINLIIYKVAAYSRSYKQNINNRMFLIGCSGPGKTNVLLGLKNN